MSSNIALATPFAPPSDDWPAIHGVDEANMQRPRHPFRTPETFLEEPQPFENQVNSYISSWKPDFTERPFHWTPQPSTNQVNSYISSQKPAATEHPFNRSPPINCLQFEGPPFSGLVRNHSREDVHLRQFQGPVGSSRETTINSAAPIPVNENPRSSEQGAQSSRKASEQIEQSAGAQRTGIEGVRTHQFETIRLSYSLQLPVEIEKQWEERFHSRIKTLVALTGVKGPTAIHLVSAYRRHRIRRLSDERLKPTILIIVSTSAQRKSVEKEFKKDRWSLLRQQLQESQIRWLVVVSSLAYCTSNTGAFESPKSSTAAEAHIIDAFKRFTSHWLQRTVSITLKSVNNECMLSVIFQSLNEELKSGSFTPSGARASIGGAILVDDKLYGLTVAHGFLQPYLDPLDAQNLQQSTAEDDSSSLASDREAETWGCSDSDATNSSSGEENHAVDCNLTPLEKADVSSTYYRSSLISAFGAGPGGCGRLGFRRAFGPGVPLQTDWALIGPFDRRVLLDTSSQRDIQAESVQGLKSRTSIPRGGLVHCYLPQRGRVEGIIGTSTVSISIGSIQYDTRQIVLDRAIEPGDSGSWIIQHQSLCGVIIAGCGPLPWAYMLPIQNILDSICHVIGSQNVSIPTHEQMMSHDFGVQTTKRDKLQNLNPELQQIATRIDQYPLPPGEPERFEWEKMGEDHGKTGIPQGPSAINIDAFRIAGPGKHSPTGQSSSQERQQSASQGLPTSKTNLDTRVRAADDAQLVSLPSSSIDNDLMQTKADEPPPSALGTGNQKVGTKVMTDLAHEKCQGETESVTDITSRLEFESTRMMTEAWLEHIDRINSPNNEAETPIPICGVQDLESQPRDQANTASSQHAEAFSVYPNTFDITGDSEINRLLGGDTPSLSSLHDEITNSDHKTLCKYPRCRFEPGDLTSARDLTRRNEQYHANIRKVIVCVNRASEENSLNECKQCSRYRFYNADYNAGEHLRRIHFNPKPKKRGKREIPAKEKRGGKSGLDWPSMSELRKWMITFDVDEDDRVVSNLRKVDEQSDVLMPDLEDLCPPKGIGEFRKNTAIGSLLAAEDHQTSKGSPTGSAAMQSSLLGGVISTSNDAISLFQARNRELETASIVTSWGSITSIEEDDDNKTYPEPHKAISSLATAQTWKEKGDVADQANAMVAMSPRLLSKLKRQRSDDDLEVDDKPDFYKLQKTELDTSSFEERLKSTNKLNFHDNFDPYEYSVEYSKHDTSTPSKPQCWDHGCNGRRFSTFSNLLRHQRETNRASTKNHIKKEEDVLDGKKSQKWLPTPPTSNRNSRETPAKLPQ